MNSKLKPKGIAGVVLLIVLAGCFSVWGQGDSGKNLFLESLLGVPSSLLAKSKGPGKTKQKSKTPPSASAISTSESQQAVPEPVLSEKPQDKPPQDNGIAEPVPVTTPATPEESKPQAPGEKSYSTLSLEDFDKTVSALKTKDWILSLRGQTSASQQEDNIRKFLLADKDSVKELLPFLRSEDLVLVKNTAFILGIRNLSEAFLPLRQRIENEKSALVQPELYRAIGHLTGLEATAFLNEQLLSLQSVDLLKIVARALQGRASTQALQKARDQVVKAVSMASQADWMLLLASMGESTAFAFARSHFNENSQELTRTCLDILFYSKDPADLKTLLENKRLFFKSVPLMQSFLRARANLESANLSGAQKYSAMLDVLSKDPSLLAWLTLFVAKDGHEESLAWFASFSRNRVDLLAYPEFIQALSIRNLPQPTRQETGAGESAESPGNSSGNPATSSGPQQKGVLRLDFSGAVVYLNGQKRDVSKSRSLEVPAGECELKAELPEGTAKILLRVKPNLMLPVSLVQSKEKASFKNSIGMALQCVPPGEYTAGSKALSLPEHRVRISRSLYAGVYEVTNAEFERWRPENKKIRDRRSLEDAQPVILVSWYDAVLFCNWLSEKEKLSPAYDSNSHCSPTADGYRLPSEAEWEYLARGGLEKNLYPWVGALTMNGVYFANFAPSEKDADRFLYTAPVGSYVDNDFGLFDMAGNVSEWCDDWYREDTVKLLPDGKTIVDPPGPDDGSEKVCRGGSWLSRVAIQCAYREFAHPSDKSNARGFRVVRLAPSAVSFKPGEYQPLAFEP